MPAIEVDGLSRSFNSRSGSVDALKDVSFEVQEGEIVALLGTNGAGKTTLAKVLSTLLLPTGGQARLLGSDVVRQAARCRRFTSIILGGEKGLYGRLTGRENLRFFGMLAGVPRRELRSAVPNAIAQAGLLNAADRPVETYSKGMRQRLHIAIGLLPRPRILLLDEPTVGLDPIEASRLRRLVKECRDDGSTVLLTSHYLLDVEDLADRILLLDDGRLTADLSVKEFARLAGYTAIVKVRGRGPLPLVHALPEGVEVADLGEGSEWLLTLRVRQWSSSVFAKVGEAIDATEVVDVVVQEARLEEAFSRVASECQP